MTTYKYVPKTKIEIPADWTGEQAKIIWEFLVEEIAEAIYNVYGDRIERAVEKEETLLDRAACDELTDDDYPF
jgi:predicted HAD superfamily Cof-like phosphohydrolase